jgi:hypothetical protein
MILKFVINLFPSIKSKLLELDILKKKVKELEEEIIKKQEHINATNKFYKTKLWKIRNNKPV